jgi:hypothetical protein
MEDVRFDCVGCHLVLMAPSTALRGNWPGEKARSVVTGWHWARLPVMVLLKPARRFVRTTVLLKWRAWIVWSERPEVTGMGAVAKVLFAEGSGLGRRWRVVCVLLEVALTGRWFCS